MNTVYRLYLRSFGSIICRHDLCAANNEEAILISSVLAGAFSSQCDEFEIWQGRQVIRHGCRRDHASLNGEVSTRILSAAKEEADRIRLDGWQVAERGVCPSVRKLWENLPAPENRLTQFIGEALSVTGADMGNIQILDTKSKSLRIAAHQGFETDFLDFFALVRNGESACGSALNSLRRVIVHDVATSPIFNARGREVMLDSGSRSVQSTPLVCDGRLVGMLSTHRRSKWRVDARELTHLDRIAVDTAEQIAGGPEPA